MIARHHFNLLCVDDDTQILDSLKNAFDAFCYDIETAQNGFVALQKIKKSPQRFQLIITDIRMPSMGGFDLVEQTRAAGYGDRSWSMPV